jgi:hypothetical protein
MSGRNTVAFGASGASSSAAGSEVTAQAEPETTHVRRAFGDVPQRWHFVRAVERVITRHHDSSSEQHSRASRHWLRELNSSFSTAVASVSRPWSIASSGRGGTPVLWNSLLVSRGFAAPASRDPDRRRRRSGPIADSFNEISRCMQSPGPTRVRDSLSST